MRNLSKVIKSTELNKCEKAGISHFIKIALTLRQQIAIGKKFEMEVEMWCKNNGCCHYDVENNKCTRRGAGGSNKDKTGVCWMEKTEGEY